VHVLSVLLLLAACDDGSGKARPSLGSTDDFQVTDNGYVDTFIDVKSTTRSFLVTARTTDYLMVDRVIDPSGAVVMNSQDWWYDHMLTMGVYPQAEDVVFNWPVRSADAPLTAGTYTVTLLAFDANYNRPYGDEVQITRYTRKDDEPANGTLKIRFVWAQGLDQNAALVSGVEAAADQWRTIYEAAGIDMRMSWRSSDLDPHLPEPALGDPEIARIVADTDPDQVNVLLGETVGTMQGLLGEAGGIPGDMARSEKAAVAVDLIENAGADLELDDAEITMLATTLAHEVGHYLGLFHPVESSWDLWDALDDTEECSNQNRCIDSLGANLMFCMAICDWTSCMVQESLTANQAAVFQRYTGIE